MSRKCKHPGCAKRPSFNREGEKARFCGDHKEDGMVNVKNKRCEMCDKRPNFNMEGEITARFCMEHKVDGMVNVVS